MSRPADDPTIFAVSSPPGAASCALIRLSGPAAIEAAGALSEEGDGALRDLPGFRGAALTLALPGLRAPAWAIVFRSPRSYTREDMVELTVPGSMPLLGAIARALERAGAARWARPGEFTFRAFLNGRIDLSQAESVAHLIGAAGEAEARASRRGLRGEIRGRLEEVREGIITALALLEAALDFPDEDLPQTAPEILEERIARPAQALAALRRSTSLRAPGEGNLRVVLAGFPNAGKSSLMNALSGREVALASEHPGTTRDPLRAVTVLSGRRVEWIDVAGSRRLEDFFEDAGSRAQGLSGPSGEGDPAILAVVRRLTRLEMAAADVVVWVAEPLDRLEESAACFRRIPEPGAGGPGAAVLAIQKGDLLGEEARRAAEDMPDRPVVVSARERWGLEALIERVIAGPRKGGGSSAQPPLFLVSAYQATWLDAAAEALDRARAAIRGPAGPECAAVDLREALGSLGEVSGETPRDALYDYIFSRFCIGK